MLEAYVPILAVAATIGGLLMSISFFPQAYKMHRLHSSENISLASYLITFVALIPWLLYGISISNMPLMITNSVSLCGAGLVIIDYFLYYKKGKKKK